MTRFGPSTAIEIRPYGSLSRLALLSIAGWVVVCLVVVL